MGLFTSIIRYLDILLKKLFPDKQESDVKTTIIVHFDKDLAEKNEITPSTNEDSEK